MTPLLLIHVVYILNTLDRSVAWAPQGLTRIPIGRVELGGEHRDIPSWVLSPHHLATRLLPIFLPMAVPPFGWAYEVGALMRPLGVNPDDVFEVA